MNILRTGQTEVGGSMMNQVRQTSVVKAVREKKLMMNMSDALTLKTTQMMSFLLLSPQTRNICIRAANYNTLRTSGNKRSRS